MNIIGQLYSSVSYKKSYLRDNVIINEDIFEISIFFKMKGKPVENLNENGKINHKIDFCEIDFSYLVLTHQPNLTKKLEIFS